MITPYEYPAHFQRMVPPLPGALRRAAAAANAAETSRPQASASDRRAPATDALMASFPAVVRLVDARFFAYAANEFARQSDGASFPTFLSTFAPCQGLPYLADVARLEGAIDAARHGATLPARSAETLLGVGLLDLTALTLKLQPTLNYLASPWPITRIWWANQSTAEASRHVSLDEGGVRLEVRRVGTHVVFRHLDLGVYDVRRALADGRSVGASLSAALDIDPFFDLVAAIRDLFCDGLVVGFNLNPMVSGSRSTAAG